MKKTVFLGGTCAGSGWRDRLIPKLEADCFDPVVNDWNEEAMKKEIKAKDESDVCLYVLTPASDSPFSIAEVVDDSNKRPSKVVFHFMKKDEVNGTVFEYNPHQLKALDKIGKLIRSNGAQYAETEEELIAIIGPVLEQAL